MTPEQPSPQIAASLLELHIALAVLQQRIEAVETNENTIERTHALDDLLEQRDWLEEELYQTQRK